MSTFSVLFACLLLAVGSFVRINSELEPDHRIIGGEEVEISSHPYQLTFQKSGVHHCGAVIIGKKWAITAAHCLGRSQFPYTLGAGNRHKYYATFHTVSRVIPHYFYASSTLDYDAALLEIEDEFTYGENVQPIRLADEELTHGELVNITGWGATKEGGYETNFLMKVTVPIVDRAICKEVYEHSAIVTERMICGGFFNETEKNSCQGDSGGPVAANGILYGLVSWAKGCARPGYPTVYTNIAYLRPWIFSVTGI